VGEFHYLHHGVNGVPYADPSEMGLALVQAAAEAGVRLTLLDTCYLAGGLGAGGHLPLDGAQQRFGDGDADRWVARVDALRAQLAGGSRGGLVDDVVVGAAVHSVRAVPRDQLSRVRSAVDGWRHQGPVPLHAHLSEQPAENEAATAFYGLTPTALLQSEGLLGPQTVVVHATHLTADDVATLGSTSTTACFCPTTERDLADGLGPARELFDAGATLALGSDQHAVVDMFEDARGLEAHERLRTLQRGRFTPSQLVAAMTSGGHSSLGRPRAGRLAPGAPADLVAVRLDSVRTAGSLPAQVVHSATAADVHRVIVGGRTIVADGAHLLGDVGTLLRDAIEPLWEGR
jgi:formiminoglutamate deiminase